MERRENRLVLALPDDLGTMHSDITRVRQMLFNLLSNAAKFTERGAVTLAAARVAQTGSGDVIRFSVTDTGIGMSEEQLAKLFQRFQQADQSTTRQFGGTGLGLALTKAFASLLGGEVAVTSTPGRGSTFTVCLPAALGESAAAAAVDGSSHPEAQSGDVVLIVDDDATQRDLMTRFLTREGFVARSAADGPTGLALAQQLRPRAILLDVTMPGMDGWSVLGALKADPALADIPVVMVTFVSERALAESLGASDYVVKPVNWDRLRHVMEQFRPVEGHVLVVDDEADARHLARQALERNGWHVAEAANGREALDSVAVSVPHVILLDLNMPVMDGFECLARLRARPGCESLPVIVLTARDLTPDDRRRLRGANQILHKGDVNLREVAERLRRLEGDGVGSEKVEALPGAPVRPAAPDPPY
jgi:CheY-like chemotaxis protein/anti-sigma regulatory factor (Ser/Thr protein kinase)